MKMLFFAAAIAMLPNLSMAAGQPGHHHQKKSAPAAAPIKRNPCAAYGAGFVQINGSSTCVKVGGSVSFEAGGNLRR